MARVSRSGTERRGVSGNLIGRGGEESELTVRSLIASAEMQVVCPAS